MPTNAAATGAWTVQTRNNARQGRALIQSLFSNNDAAPFNGTRSGVVYTTGYTVSSDLFVQVTSGLTMSVSGGTGVIYRSGQGPYVGWLTGSVSITCDAAPVSNPRNDIVIMRIYDAVQGDTVPGSGPCQIEIVTGTPAASPVDPVTPNAVGVITTGFGAGGGVAIPLFRAQVSTGGVITLTDIRRGTSLIGAVRPLMPGDNPATAGIRVGELRMNGDSLDVLNSSAVWVPVLKGEVGYAEVTANSATWNSATKVVTNLTTTFTGIAGGVYRVTADGSWQCASASNMDSLGIGWRLGGAGTVVNTDPIVGSKGQRSHPDATGINPLSLLGRFTAVSSGTHCVAVVGWKPTGNTGVSNLFANSTYSSNRIFIDRVA